MKYILKFILLLISISILSCDQEIGSFKDENNFIYFNIPFKPDRYGRDSDERIDSFVYTFALEDVSVKSYIFKILVNSIGTIKSFDRNYIVEFIKDSSNVTDQDWLASSISNKSIKKGELIDTLMVEVFRTETIKTESRRIYLKLKSNNFFDLGEQELTKVIISYSDILIPPDWWDTWKGYFGEYSREKFLKWQEIYHYGADPNLHSNGELYYWDNMPSSPISSWYPSTFMFINILKQYFIDNEIYPDGDKSKPRITLP